MARKGGQDRGLNVISRRALSCPECRYPISLGFKHVCRQCGARLVMVRRILRPNHYRVFVRGPSVALYELASALLWLGVPAAAVWLYHWSQAATRAAGH